MTIPNHNTTYIALSQIRDEFQVPGEPIGLGSFYKGGTYVPSDTVGAIPASGEISMLAFSGVTKPAAAPVYGPLVVTPYDVYEQEYATGFNTSTHNSYPEVGVSGGKSPYTYAWSFNGLPNGWTIVGATTSQFVQIRHFVGKFGGYYSCIMQCIVTDSNNPAATQTVNVNVEVEYLDPNNPAQ